MKAKTNPLNKGANAERTAIIAKVRRLIKMGSRTIIAEWMLDWLLKRHDRCNRRKGGIGKG